MSYALKRTQIYLAKDQFQKISQLAKEKHTSFAQVMREAVTELLRKNREKWDLDPISKHIGSIEAKETDLSLNHDRYIYGE